MTDEGLPVARKGDPPSPELRASHEDRERAAEVLRVAGGDGRLTMAELDERLEMALTARTSGELAALTADLPEVGAVAEEAKEVVRIDYRGANATRRGRWVVPRRMEINAVGGAVRLDFTDAVITGPTLQIQAQVRGGKVLMLTKPGMKVDADDVVVSGGKLKVSPDRSYTEPVSLTVTISGEVRGGVLLARPARSFPRWLLPRRRT